MSENAEFTHAGTYTVGFSNHTTTDRLVVTGGDVTLDLNLQTYSALKPSFFATTPASLHINGAGSPSLTVTDGLLDIKSAVLGEGYGNSGALVVDGVGSLLDVEESLYLGQLGTGRVTVLSGAKGKARNVYLGMTGGTLSDNTFSVLGTGSVFTIADQLNIGFFGGHGNAGANAGGVLKSGELILAPDTNAEGQVVAGPDSHVHIQGDALLGSASGGTGGKATLWPVGGGTITIDGALKYDHNTKLILNGALDVGSMTRVNGLPHVGSLIHWQGGSLRVRSDVTTFDLGIPYLDEDAAIQIDGDLHLDVRRSFDMPKSGVIISAASLSGNGDFTFTQGRLNLGTLTLGTEGDMRQSLVIDGASLSTTKLNVSDVTDIQPRGHLALSMTTATFDGIVLNSGSLHINQSQVAFNGIDNLGFQGLLSIGNLSIADSTVAGSVVAGPGSEFTVNGQVTFNGPVKTRVDITRPVGADRPKVHLNSEFHIGTVTSQTTSIAIGADVALGPDSKLLFDIGGTGTGEYDTLDVEGGMTLGGTLEVSFLAGFTPTLGDRFQLFTAGRLVGMFSDLDLPSLAGGMKFDTQRIQLGELLVVSGVSGDYNNDGVVDAADYVVWRNALGTSALLTNDNTPGVEIDDYRRWERNYGRSMEGAPVAAKQVPEPAGMAAIVLCLCLVARCRKTF